MDYGINQLFKFTLAASAHIRNVHTFPVTTLEDGEGNKYYIRGVEIALKESNYTPDSTTDVDNSDYPELHFNPFQSARGYIYLALATKRDFDYWVVQTLEGKIASLVCAWNGYFQKGSPTREKLQADYQKAKAEVAERYPQYTETINQLFKHI